MFENDKKFKWKMLATWREPMKFSPRYIIYWAVSRYLTEEQIEQFKKDIVKGNLKQDRRFLSELKKHIDLERLVRNPLIPQDAYIYNYIQYEVKTQFPRNGLIARYEREIVLPTEETFKKFLELLQPQK